MCKCAQPVNVHQVSPVGLGTEKNHRILPEFSTLGNKVETSELTVLLVTSLVLLVSNQ